MYIYVGIVHYKWLNIDQIKYRKSILNFVFSIGNSFYACSFPRECYRFSHASRPILVV